MLGASPTGSGLQILPLMGGLLVTSISSGQLISRTGRYKPFPIAGTAIMVVGLALLSTMGPHTTRLTASAFMFVLGLGLGLVMQVLVLAVQNAVDYKDLGVATSGATLFRSIGGSVGTAVLGSIFSNRLTAELASSLPRSAAGKLGSGASLNTAALKKLPAPIHDAYLTAFTNALSTVFIVAASIAAVAFLLSWALQQRPLRETVAAGSGIGETFAMPRDTDSLGEASRALTALVGRDRRRELVAGIAERAGVDLSPAAAWLVVRLQEDPTANIAELCQSFDIPLEVGQQAFRELDDRGLLQRDPAAGDGRGRVIGLTAEGHQVATQLVEERRATLARICADWSPESSAACSAGWPGSWPESRTRSSRRRCSAGPGRRERQNGKTAAFEEGSDGAGAAVRRCRSRAGLRASANVPLGRARRRCGTFAAVGDATIPASQPPFACGTFAAVRDANVPVRVGGVIRWDVCRRPRRRTGLKDRQPPPGSLR